jgi:hypothetical protein
MAWYDDDDGKDFLGVLRKLSVFDQVDSSLDPNAKLAWLMGMSQPAIGTITFNVTPADGDTVTLNGTDFQFKNAPGGNHFFVQTNADLATAINNLIAAIQYVIDHNTNPVYTPKIAVGHYSQPAPGVLQVLSYFQPEVDTGELIVGVVPASYDPNAYTLAASVATVSGPTLQGASEEAVRLSLPGLFSWLPTADPLIPGMPWVDVANGNVLKISQG